MADPDSASVEFARRSANAAAERERLGRHLGSYSSASPSMGFPVMFIVVFSVPGVPLIIIAFVNGAYLLTVAGVILYLGILWYVGDVRSRISGRNTGRVLHLYEAGLIIADNSGRVTTFPWASTSMFEAYGPYYKLVNGDGLVAAFGSDNAERGVTFPGVGEWANAMRQGIFDAQFQAVLYRIEQGQEIPFGDFLVGHGTLTVKRRMLPDKIIRWSDIRSVEVDEFVTLRVCPAGEFEYLIVRARYQIPNLHILLELTSRLRAVGPVGPQASRTLDEKLHDALHPHDGHIALGGAVLAFYRYASTGHGVLPLRVLGAAVVAVLAGIAVFVGVHLVSISIFRVVKVIRRLSRQRRIAVMACLLVGIATALALLVVVLFREYSSRLLPGVTLIVFGVWVVILARKRLISSSYRVVRCIPGVLAVSLVALAGHQLIYGHPLTTQPAAGLFFPLASWLCWRGWRVMCASQRLIVRAGADIVLSMLLGVLLVLFLVWLANVLDFRPGQVMVIRAVFAKVIPLTKVHWAYWLAAYTLLAVGSYTVLRWPGKVAKLKDQVIEKLRVGRLMKSRHMKSGIPVAGAVNFARRAQTGVNISLMVALLFAVTAPSVVDGSWRTPIDYRYVLEIQQQRDLEGARIAYSEIHRDFLHPRLTVVHLRSVVVAVHRIDPAPAGQPATETARRIARQLGRFQSDALDLAAPASPPTPRPSETGSIPERLEQLSQEQRETNRRTAQVEQFAQLAALAVTRTLQIPDIGDNEAVLIVSEYLSGLVEDGPAKKVFHFWGERVGVPRPDAGRMAIPDPARLAAAAYRATRDAAERAKADMWRLLLRRGDQSDIERAVHLANQFRYLHDPTGPCEGCVPAEDGNGPGGPRPGGRR